VRKDFGHIEVLSDVSFQVMAGEKTGMIGANGSGKTTVLRMLVGEDEPTRGSISRVAALRVGYVPQHVEYDEASTVLETVLAEHHALERELRDRERQLAEATPTELPRATAAYERAREAFEQAGGDRRRAQAAGMLDALGLAGRAHEPVGRLSGGEKNVMSLVRALIAEPELLVLDEPDNHLDFEGVAWLESFLRGYRGAVLIVSHNRYLLDRVVGNILHFEQGRVKLYAGNYSTYRSWVLREKIAQHADYTANQKRLAQLEALVKRFEEFARRTADPAWGKRLRARRSQLERERAQAVDRPVAEQSSIRFRTRGEASQADVALQLRGYSKSFGDLCLFDGAQAEVLTGERAALIGANGSGKTTLLREVMARGAWDDDVIRIGPSMRVGYCSQTQEVLDERNTVLAELTSDGTMSRQQASSLLAQFLFRPDDFEKRVSMLSGGERNRLQLAKVLSQKPNFLILDEPTNHLDIAAREAVEEVLLEFKGTLLLVSHDRYLLDKIATRVIEVRDRALHSCEGNFSDYWAARAPEKAPRARVTTRRRTRERVTTAPAPRRKRPAAESEALSSAIASAEAERIALEKRLAAAFADGDYREGSRVGRQLEQQDARLRDLYEKWVAAEE
jgi:ATP-binding cassette subfamily F protein 3